MLHIRLTRRSPPDMLRMRLVATGPARRHPFGQGPSGRRLVLSAVAAASVGAVQAQDLLSGGGTRRTTIEPLLSLDQTVTDNYAVSAANKSADAITRLSAGVATRIRAARVSGFFDYRLTELLYARHSAENNHQQALSSQLQADLIEGRLSLESAASISRAAVSAFAAGAASSELANTNSTEVRQLRLSPVLRGQLGGQVAYSVRGNWQLTDVADRALGDSTQHSVLLHLEPQRAGLLSWGLDAQTDTTDYKKGSRSTSERLFGSMFYTLTALDLRLGANGGSESSNLGLSQSETRPTWGVSAAWTPSPRTHLDADYGERFYGRAYSLRGEYRTALTVWHLGGSRSLNTGSSTATAGARGTAFDLFYNQLASVEPDAAKRADRVTALLARNGIDPLASADPAFLTGAVTLVNQIDASAAWRSARNTAVLTWTRSTTRRADQLAVVADDLAAASEVRAQALGLSLAHQLTPDSALTANITLRQSDGQTAAQRSTLRQVDLRWNRSLNRQITVALGARRALYELNPAPFSESALTATVGARF